MCILATRILLNAHTYVVFSSHLNWRHLCTWESIDSSFSCIASALPLSDSCHWLRNGWYALWLLPSAFVVTTHLRSTHSPFMIQPTSRPPLPSTYCSLPSQIHPQCVCKHEATCLARQQFALVHVCPRHSPTFEPVTMWSFPIGLAKPPATRAPRLPTVNERKKARPPFPNRFLGIP